MSDLLVVTAVGLKILRILKLLGKCDICVLETYFQVSISICFRDGFGVTQLEILTNMLMRPCGTSR